MTQYIPKSALVAEIEKLRKNAWESFQKGNSTEEQYYLRYGVIQDILSFLNTLEVKEVDLEKELIEWHKEHFKKDGTFIGKSGFYLTNNSQMAIAKHFFELGMQVSNKAQKGELYEEMVL